MKSYVDDYKEETFEGLIGRLLTEAGLDPDKYLTEENIKKYQQAFTSSTVDPEFNYEVYETLGDLVIGKIINNYFWDKYPELHTPKGVEVLARAKIVFGSHDYLAEIGKKMGIDFPHIKASDYEAKYNRTGLIEDIIEAFFGVTEDIVGRQKGFEALYKLLVKYLEIAYGESLKIVDKFLKKKALASAYGYMTDAVTRFKEIMDKEKTDDGAKYQYDGVYKNTPKSRKKIFEYHGKKYLVGNYAYEISEHSHKTFIVDPGTRIEKKFHDMKAYDCKIYIADGKRPTMINGVEYHEVTEIIPVKATPQLLSATADEAQQKVAAVGLEWFRKKGKEWTCSEDKLVKKKNPDKMKF